MPRRFIHANEPPTQPRAESFNRKRIRVGPPLRLALDARPSREPTDVVNTVVARYHELLMRTPWPIFGVDVHDNALGLLAKWSLVVNRDKPMPSSFEEVMVTPARIKLMIGPENSKGCEAIEYLRSLTYQQLVAMLDKAEGMGGD